MIGADRSNQFFLTTHNPYFLTGIVEKTPAEDLAFLSAIVTRKEAPVRSCSLKRIPPR